MEAPLLPLQGGHPLVVPGTGRVTPPWLIFFQHLIANLHQAVLAPVQLGSEVIGILPWSNLAPVSGPGKLLGRGMSGAGPIEEITLGPGLTMSGTTLSASGGSGGGYWTPITNGDATVPEILFDAGGDCVVGFVPTS